MSAVIVKGMIENASKTMKCHLKQPIKFNMSAQMHGEGVLLRMGYPDAVYQIGCKNETYSWALVSSIAIPR